MQVFLPPEGLANFGEANPTQDNVFCAQLQRFQIRAWTSGACTAGTPKTATKNSPSSAREVQKSPVWLHSGVLFMLVLMYWYQPDRFLQQDKRVWTSETTWWTRAIISRLKGRPVSELHVPWGEPEMCVAALCERPQGCQHFRKDPKECCKFTCLIPVLSQSL